MKTLFSGGNGFNRKHSRARILDLLARSSKVSEIAVVLGCSPITVYDVKYCYQAEKLESDFTEKQRSGKPPRLNGE